jgi:hypothetical protein
MICNIDSCIHSRNNCSSDYTARDCRCTFLSDEYQEGIDEFELHVDPDVPVDAETAVQRAKVLLHRQGLLVSAVPKADKLLDDYDPAWMLGAHPSTFPYNKGARPANMSEERWARCIVQRYPAAQFARNLGLLSDLFNVTQRHAVNRSAWIQFRCRPDQQAAVSALSEDDIQTVLEAIATRKFGAALRATMDTLPAGAWTLYNGMKAVGGRVVGTPQSFLSLRSKVLSAPAVYGAYTCQINLSPSEIGAKWTFDLAGESYTHDFDGRPSDRPHLVQCKQIIAANPVACAEFLMAYLRGFVAVFCGWPMGSDRQVNPDCLFGAIHALYLKYESSTRGGLHAHGQAIQRFLQALHLRKFMADTDAVKEHLFAFFEALTWAFFPVPQYAPTAAPGPAMWPEMAPKLPNGA